MDSSLSIAKIADFGTAKMLDSKTFTANLTKGNFTPRYSAPEMLDGDEDFKPTVKIDIYSFGITL